MTSCNPNAITVRDVCTAAALALGDLRASGRLAPGHRVMVSALGWSHGRVLLALLDPDRELVTEVPACVRVALDGALNQFHGRVLLDTPGTWTEAVA